MPGSGGARLSEEVRVGDPRLYDYTELTDVARRRVREPAEGIFLAEGEKTIRRALDAGYRPRSAFMSPKWWPGLVDVLGEWDIDILLADDDVLAEVTGFHVHRGALASMERRPLADPRDLLVSLPERALVVVLEDLVNHTNVGAVFRNAAALGAAAVLISPACADPLYRRSVKVSMGAVFSVPWTRAHDWPGDLEVMRELGFDLLALTPAPGSVALGTVATGCGPRRALLLGTEGDGLSDDAMTRATALVRVPMAHGVDSLNVAAASAVACYALGGAADD